MLTAMAMKALPGYTRSMCIPRSLPIIPAWRFLKLQDIAYEPFLTGSADLVFEATGSTEAALAALAEMPPLGVMVVLGAPDGTGSVPFLRMIVNNQTVIGSVNSSPEAFRSAVEDLARFDRRALASLIARSRFSDLPSQPDKAGIPSLQRLFTFYKLHCPRLYPLRVCHMRHRTDHSNEAFQGWSFADAAKFVRATGYSGLEIAPFTLAESPTAITHAERANYRDILQSEGLAFVGLHWLMVSPKGLHVTTPDNAASAVGSISAI